jgi:NAD(P)-dependent dehydrogenase (short-subunit alcohol dehydrogenase family)
MVNSESKGKVALVTGANKGLGFEMSRQLAQQGLTVIIAARKLEAAVAAATILENEGLNAEAIALDINDSNQIQSAEQNLAIVEAPDAITKVIVKETAISPRFYTTNLRKMSKIDTSVYQEAFNAIIGELKKDQSKEKFIRDEDFIRCLV